MDTSALTFWKERPLIMGKLTLHLEQKKMTAERAKKRERRSASVLKWHRNQKPHHPENELRERF